MLPQHEKNPTLSTYIDPQKPNYATHSQPRQITFNNKTHNRCLHFDTYLRKWLRVCYLSKHLTTSEKNYQFLLFQTPCRFYDGDHDDDKEALIICSPIAAQHKSFALGFEEVWNAPQSVRVRTIATRGHITRCVDSDIISIFASKSVQSITTTRALFYA